MSGSVIVETAYGPVVGIDDSGCNHKLNSIGRQTFGKVPVRKFLVSLTLMSYSNLSRVINYFLLPSSRRVFLTGKRKDGNESSLLHHGQSH
jgi:hypothetical protein